MEVSGAEALIVIYCMYTKTNANRKSLYEWETGNDNDNGVGDYHYACKRGVNLLIVILALFEP
jgi:hypothetical protein